MLAKEVLRNSMDLNRRIKEQCVIYQDWKAMAMEIDEDEIHEIVEAAWDDLIASVETGTGRTYHGKSQCRPS